MEQQISTQKLTRLPVVFTRHQRLFALPAQFEEKVRNKKGWFLEQKKLEKLIRKVRTNVHQLATETKGKKKQ